jgi:4a-hydroxytetrahydrobiopterin dehydratase
MEGRRARVESQRAPAALIMRGLTTMSGLTQATCVPCRGGVPTLTDPETASLLPQVPGWKVAEVGGVKRLQREFEFKDFRSAMEFAVKVGELAEREQHHPDLHVSWGRVMVETWTHKIHGLHQNDFILAAKINALKGG